VMRSPQAPEGADDRVVVTRFECGSLAKLLALSVLHMFIRRAAIRDTQGLVVSTSHVSWGSRTLVSVSLWRSLRDVYSMGQCREHVIAARIPHRWGIRTACAMFRVEGDWRNIMFGASMTYRSPFKDLSESNVSDLQA
jgi:hypothetical protein